jgi:metal-responsive CopG/Arc/MetJ family transcriptional regulator
MRVEVFMTANRTYRKSFTFHPTLWEKLSEIAPDLGFPNRNQLIGQTLKKIIADHEQAKSHDLA